MGRTYIYSVYRIILIILVGGILGHSSPALFHFVLGPINSVSFIAYIFMRDFQILNNFYIMLAIIANCSNILQHSIYSSFNEISLFVVSIGSSDVSFSAIDFTSICDAFPPVYWEIW